MTTPSPPGELLSWAISALGAADSSQSPDLAVVAGDASNRRYYRATLAGKSHVLVSAPPATEKNREFLAVRKLLAEAGVRVPELYAADLERGYLLLEDLGDRLMLPELAVATADASYQLATGVLLRMAAIETQDLQLPPYNEDLLTEELGRFPTWFVQTLLGQELSAAEQAMLEALSARLVASALEQPLVLVHRDFHSRNLMPQEEGGLAVIDFQDAVVGPVTYDLVSLLRDCYVRWPREQVRHWALAHRDALRARGMLGDADAQRFLHWFDLMGLQRHIKVLGTFARLYLRDAKPAYLEDLPLVIDYVLEIAGLYAPQEPELAAFHQWFKSRLSPVIAQQPWSATQ